MSLILIHVFILYTVSDYTRIGYVPISFTLGSLLGWRIGKGEGFADLEYAMMRTVKAVHEFTPVVTTVHDCQVCFLTFYVFVFVTMIISRKRVEDGK